jgi:hypothetical protein
MKYLLSGMIALSLLTACGQNDKSAPDAPLSAVELSGDRLQEVRVRDGDPATASQALMLLSLAEGDAGLIRFESRDLTGDRAVFTNVTVADDSVDGSDGTVTIGRMELDGLATVDGAPSFSLLRMNDIAFSPAATGEDRGQGRIAKMELINPSPALAAWISRSMSGEEDGEPPSGADLAFDRWLVEGVNIRIDDASGAGTLALNNFYVDAVAEEKVGVVALSGLNFDFAEADGQTLKVKLDGLGLRGMNLSQFVEALNESDGGADFARGLQAGASLQSNPGDPGFDALTLRGLAMDVAGASLSLPTLDASVTRDSRGRATRMTTPEFTMAIAPRDNVDGEEFASMLALVGYERLDFTMAGEQVYDPDRDFVTLAKGKNYWSLRDGFRIDFGASYQGASALAAAQSQSNLNADPMASLDAVLKELTIHGVELAIRDDGFFNRALNAYATQSGEDPQQVRAQLSGLMALAPMMAGGTGIDAVVITELAQAVGAFIQDPKTLTIRLAPASPMPLQTFADAAANPSQRLTKAQLGFSAENK